MRRYISFLAFCKLLVACLSFMYAGTVGAADYVYAYMPAYQTYTTLGSGTVNKPIFDYNNDCFDGGREDYAANQSVCGVFGRNTSTGTITVRVKKGSGYFVNGNSGKIFILSTGDGQIYVTKFSISNPTTSYVTATIPNLGDFTGKKTFEVFLITSDQVYKQYAGEITITGSTSVLPPTVQVDEATDITSTTATLNGRINPNGNKTKYYFKYGTTSPMTESTATGTIPASSGEVSKSVTVTGLTPDTRYYFELYAYNEGDTVISGMNKFHTEESNSAPTTPKNYSPKIGVACSASSGTLSWECSDPNGDALTYDVYMGETTSSMSRVYSGTKSSYTYSNLTPGIYYWYVTASDGETKVTGETIWFQAVSDNNVPDNLKIVGGTYFGTSELVKGKSYTFRVKVKNNASSSWYGAFYLKEGSNNVLDWRSTIGAGETVELSKSYTFTSTGTKTLTLYYQTNVSGSGQVVEGSANPFTISVVVPATPLSTPSNGSFTATNATTTGFTAKWAAVQDATKYDIQVAQASQAWATIAYSGTTSATSINVTGLKPGCQYLFRVRARNDYQTGEWSDALKTAIETLHASSASADLKIVQENCIKDETVTVGVPATYNAYVKNNGSEDWTGAFYLKEGTTLIADWQNRTISSRSAILLDCKYVPSMAGNHPLTLYYQTDGTGDGIIVPQGSCQNPFVVSVAAATVDENMLTLKSAMTCSPDNITLGGSATLYAKVENKGGSTWSGSVYFTDNGKALTSQTIDLAIGSTKTIYCTSWTPSVVGPHYIKLMCAKSNATNEGVYVLDGEDCCNGLTVYVTDATETTVPSQVNFVHVTEDVVPKTVTEETDVYYFFRVTDSNNQPVSGVKATFVCEANNACTKYTTDASDAQGIICVHISTDDSDANVTRGGTLTLSSPALSDVSGNAIERLNKSNTTISLKVKDGGIFENVEKVSVEMTPSVGAKVGEENVASVRVGLSMPFTFNLIFDDDDNLSSIGYEREFSLEGEANASLLGCINTKTKGSIGCKKSESLNMNRPGRSFSYEFIEWLKHYTVYSNPALLLAAQVLEDWVESKTNSYFGCCINSSTTSDYFGWSVEGELNVLEAFPSMKGNLLKSTRLPSLSFGTMELSGSAEFKYEFDKQMKDATRGVTTYGDARSLKYKLGGTTGLDLGRWSYSTKKHPWWQSADVTKAYEKLLKKIEPKNQSSSFYWTFAIDEEEMYTTNDKNVLDQISCEASISKCWELSEKEEKLNICKGWKPSEASFKLSNTCTNKLSSQGSWAAYLQDMSNSSTWHRVNAGNIYPILTGKSIIGEPLRYYNMFTQGFSSSLANLSGGDVDSYSLKNSLKVEQQNSSKVEFGVKVDLLSELPFLKLTVGLELATTADYYPSESYYSFADKRFMPVALRPAESVGSLLGKVTNSVQSQLKDMFTNDESDEIREFWEKRSAKVGTGAVASQPVYLTTEGLRQSAGGGGGTAWLPKRAIRRRPALAAAYQTDISIFSFAINEGETSFDVNTDLCLVDFYPAGDLIAITDLGDTLFVVSDVARLIAVNGDDTLSTSPLGTFKLDTYVGMDDLTPFGFSKDQPLDLYYLEDGGEYWHYVGPAGTRANIKELGSYAMATSIRDDVLAPAIAATFNRATHRIRLNITDNIGILPATLRVYVNGKLQEVASIDESNFIMQVDHADLQDMFTLYVTIKDIAGNEAHLFQMYDYDAETGIVQVVDKNDQLTVKAYGKNVRVAGAEANVDVTVFSVSGEIVQRGTTDANGRADLSLGNVPAGAYVITLSNGVPKKIIIK